MISCPKCHATLPDWAQKCQFCQADVRAVVRPKPVVSAQRQWNTTPSWVWPCYFAMCGLFVIEGAGGIVQTFLASQQKVQGVEVGLGAFGVVSIAFEGITVLLGIGLALRVELIRGIVNFFCGLRILFGLLGLFGSLMGTLIVGALGLVFVLMHIVNIASAAFMMYLIGETERSAPNL